MDKDCIVKEKTTRTETVPVSLERQARDYRLYLDTEKHKVRDCLFKERNTRIDLLLERAPHGQELHL